MRYHEHPSADAINGEREGIGDASANPQKSFAHMIVVPFLYFKMFI